MTLQDGDLRLRPAALPEDVSLAVPWYSDPEVLYYSEGPEVEPYDADGIRGMYDYLSGIGQLYIVEVMTPEGWVPVGDATLAPHTMPIVIGDPAYRGRGYGRRVIALLVGRARQLGWERLGIKSIYTYNERSLRAYQSVGFRITETKPGPGGVPSWSLELPLVLEG